MTTRLVKQIARVIKRELPRAGATEPAVLRRIVPGERTPGNLSGGTNPTIADYPCQGFVSDETHDRIGGTLVDQTHVVVCLIGLAVTPRSTDKVTIDGKTYQVIDLEGNAACWTVLCRR